MTIGAVIVAAGSGTRMEGLDKLFTQVGARPLIAHAVEAFEECSHVDRVVVVLSAQDFDRGQQVLAEQGFRKLVAVCRGGLRRQDSVHHGLEALGPVDWVAVHDGARPLIRHEVITRGLNAARETGAAVPVVPLVDTVKQVDADGHITATLDRSTLVAVQTPQVFRYELLLRAHTEVTEDVTDDAAMLEKLGIPVRTFEGSRRNIKITTPDDLFIAEHYLL